jgi:hypothetical protein
MATHYFPVLRCAFPATLQSTCPLGSRCKLSQLHADHSGNRAAALKKMNDVRVVSYLATNHGYPDNLAFYLDLITSYNTDKSMPAVADKYFCKLI